MGVKTSLLPVLLLQGRQRDADCEQVALRNDRDRLALLPGCPLQPAVLPSGTHLCWNPHSDPAEALEAKSFALRCNRNLGRNFSKTICCLVLRGYIEPV